MFKTTQTFKLITIAEHMIIHNRVKNILLFRYNYTKYKFFSILKIKRNISPKKKMMYFEDLFKEYYYLYNIIHLLHIPYYKSNMITSSINNKINAIITYSSNDSNIILYISYDLTTRFFTLFTSFNNKSVNIDTRNLEIKEINDVAYNILKLLLNDILYMMIEIFNHYRKQNS